LMLILVTTWYRVNNKFKQNEIPFGYIPC